MPVPYSIFGVIKRAGYFVQPSLLFGRGGFHLGAEHLDIQHLGARQTLPYIYFRICPE